MEITSFILGVCAVIVVAMVVGTFMNYMSVKQLKEHLDTLDRDIHTEVQILNQNLDKETERLIDYVNNLHGDIERDLNEIQPYVDSRLDNEIYPIMDSRLDKLEAKFKNDLASSAEVRNALNEIEVLKQRMDNFIKGYQTQ